MGLKQFTTHAGYCSPDLHTVVRNELRAHVRVRGANENTPASQVFGPRHIPPLLLDEWHERHLAHIVGAQPRHIRRAAAAMLAANCVGSTIREASIALDMAASTGSYSRRTVRQHPDRNAYNAFLDAVKELEKMLIGATTLTDFGHRRHVLEDWSISPDDWKALIDGLEGRTHSQREVDNHTPGATTNERLPRSGYGRLLPAKTTSSPHSSRPFPIPAYPDGPAARPTTSTPAASMPTPNDSRQRIDSGTFPVVQAR